MIRLPKQHILITFLFLIAVSPIFSQVKVASVFSNNMVIQRNKKVPVWGETLPGEKITVKFNGQKRSAVSGNDGKWKVYLNPMPANAKGQNLIIEGKDTLTFNNVLIGDVWIMAGQSNMFRNVKSMGKINNEILKHAENPMIRFYKVPPKIAEKPQNFVDAEWKALNSNNVLNITAIGSVFAEKIQQELNVPVGIISVNMGSTSVECWVPKEIVEKEPFVKTWIYWKDLIENWDNGAYKKYLKLQQKRAERKENPLPTKETMINVTETRTLPSGAYNAMLYPLLPFAVKGIVWRQGEANTTRAVQYEKLLPVMIELWRNKFEDNLLPFVQIGLPSYGKPSENIGESIIAELRLSQQNVAKNVKNCYYIPILDLNDVKKGKGNIHPKNKYLSGCRTARFVLGNIYKIEDAVEIPYLNSYKNNGNKIVLTFSEVKNKLFTGVLMDLKGNDIKQTDEEVNNFIIAGKNKKFVKAHARIINNNKVEVWSEKVPKPVAVRYAWENLVINVNLYNGSNMPVPSFRTDSWHLSTKGNYKPKISLVRPK